MRKLLFLIVLAITLVVSLSGIPFFQKETPPALPTEEVWDPTPSAETLEINRRMTLPREQLPECDGEVEGYIASVLGNYSYDRSILPDTDQVCLEGAPEMFWLEFASYFSDASGEEIGIEDLVFVTEYTWFEVEVEGTFFYLATTPYSTHQLYKHLPECQVLVSDAVDKVSAQAESQDQLEVYTYVQSVLESGEMPAPFYGDFIICPSAVQLAPEILRENVAP